MTETLKLNFGCVNGDVTALQDVTGGEITVTPETVVEGYVFASYTFESNPLFGSSATYNNRLVLDLNANVINVCIRGDSPTPSEIFTALEDAVSEDVSITPPEYDARILYRLYSKFGVEQSVSFRNGRRGFIDGRENIDPEEIAEERALHSSKQRDKLNVFEITEEYIEDGYFIESMGVRVPEVEDRLRFIAPSIIVGVPNDSDDRIIKRLHERFHEVVTGCTDLQKY